jgi:hypothetical protein
VPGGDYIASVAAILSRGQPDTADPRESELGDQRADSGDEVVNGPSAYSAICGLLRGEATYR